MKKNAIAKNLAGYHFGTPQRSGQMMMVPIFGKEQQNKFVYPRSGLKLSVVRGYGNMELSNPAPSGIAIVPLHMGYIQDKAQNHALCSSAFIGAGQKLMFEDACCVQQAQGGYLEGRDQWFFILPLDLREEALSLRGVKDYRKLWKGISHLNQKHNLDARGHLELILSQKRAHLTQYQSRLELLPGQSGALFFINDVLVGIEISPNPGYFQELWMPLVCFCYGSAAMFEEAKHKQNPEPKPYAAKNLEDLGQQLMETRKQRLKSVHNTVAKLSDEQLDKEEEERFLSMRLHTVQSQHFAGQTVEDDGRLVYASLFATK